MLIHFGVTPYIVFDGDYLPSKAATENDRAKRREESKRAGLELFRLGKLSQAHLELQKAVDVSPEMARQLIDELRKANIEYVVAPYEADAQLVYLERKGIIQGILSEDSDLLVFGAKCLLTKLDQYGDCVEINRKDFTACRDVSLVGWTDDEFRRMAILSGCDYLASINKMGLKTAYRLVRKHKTIEKILRMLAFDGHYHIPAGYLEDFRKAELTFLHQRVFCPLANALVMATELEDGPAPDDFAFIGADVDPTIAQKVAHGDLDPMTKQPIKITRRAQTTPRTPWKVTRSQTVGSPAELKPKTSIESFFKPKRTPLAELDPNSFTPSPSQQRLIEQHEGNSWISSSAPERQPTTRTQPVPTPQRTRQIHDIRALADKSNQAASVPHPVKRQRLCSEPEGPTQTGFESSKIEQQRSRFFVSDPSPSVRKDRGRKKGAAGEINIWSDDSIEGVMLGICNVTNETKQPLQTAKVAVLRDEAPQGEGIATTTETREIAHGSRTAQDSVSTATSTTQTSSGNVTASKSTASSFTDSQIVAEKLNESVAAQLQFLKDGVLYRENSEVEIRLSPDPHVATISEPDEALKSRAVGDKHGREPSFSTDDLHVPESPTARPLGVAKGSEDMLVPNSEEEGEGSASDGEKELEEKKPRLNLGRFAFSGPKVR